MTQISRDSSLKIQSRLCNAINYLHDKMLMPKIVKVEWEDACRLDDGTWVDSETENVYHPVIMRTTGYLLYDGPEGVIVTGTFSPTEMGPRDQIPRGMIISVTVLEEKGTKEIVYPEPMPEAKKTSVKKNTK